MTGRRRACVRGVGVGLSLSAACLGGAHVGRWEAPDKLDLRLSLDMPSLPPPVSPAWPPGHAQWPHKPDEPSQTRTQTPAPEAHGPRWALDASVDQTVRHGYSRDAAITWGFGDDIDQAGLRVRLAGNRNHYSYPDDPSRTHMVAGRSQQGEVLLGRGSQWPGLSLTWLGGYAWARADEGSYPTVRQSGFKAAVSVYAVPADDWRVFSSASYARMSRYTQFYVKLGHTLDGGAFVGPEIKADWLGKEPGRQQPAAWRTGVHLSGLPWASAWWSLSAGRVQDHGIGQGGYVGLGAYRSF